MIDSSLALQIAQTILHGFDRHFALFRKITLAAKTRFEYADWAGDNQARSERIAYYDQRVNEAVNTLLDQFDLARHDHKLWRLIKLQYMGLLYEHRQPELAESFYNSVFCKIFDRRYYNHAQIFVRPGLSTEFIGMDRPVYQSYYPSEQGISSTFETALNSFGFDLEWENLQRDLELLSNSFTPYLYCSSQSAEICQIQILSSLFYRNKAAYIVGRTLVSGQFLGFIIPVLRSSEGKIYTDTLLTDPHTLAIVFSFTRAYFMVDTEIPSALVSFLQSILPGKTRSDLYTAIGFHKQGKTHFFRDYLNHLAHSNDQFVLAPGIEGMVMTVFTLPSYPYVFKVIKDKFAPPKNIDRQTVIEKYLYVKTHDRVGRMADTLEFSHVAFPKHRVSAKLLKSLKKNIASNLTIEKKQIVIRHLYIERRMIPLNLYIAKADEEALSNAVKEYGNAVKELIRANIFPGDMLLKNFGVSRQGRIIFYDYDEIVPMKSIRIRRIPPARTPEQEMATEPWYRIEDNDFFPEQFEHFVMSHPKVRTLFMQHHADLLDPAYWKQISQNLHEGVRADVFPYRQRVRFRNRHPERYC